MKKMYNVPTINQKYNPIIKKISGIVKIVVFNAFPMIISLFLRPKLNKKIQKYIVDGVVIAHIK